MSTCLASSLVPYFSLYVTQQMKDGQVLFVHPSSIHRITSQAKNRVLETMLALALIMSLMLCPPRDNASTDYALVGGASEAYGSPAVCVCVCMSFTHISLQRLQTKC